MKKIFSFILTMCLLVLSIPSFNVARAEMKTEFSFNFDETVKYDRQSGTDRMQLEAVDTARGKSMSFATGGVTELQKNVEVPITADVVKFSFDYMSEESVSPFFYIRFFNSKLKSFAVSEAHNMFETIVISDAFRWYRNSKGWVQDGGEKKLEAKRWYKIDIWLDMKERKTYHMIDGELYGATGMQSTMTDIKGVVIHSEGTAGKKLYVDNVSLTTMTEAEAVAFAKTGEAVPPEVAADVFFKFSCDEVGHIYYGKESQPFSAKLRNRTDEPKEVFIKYQIDGGEEISEPVALEPNEEKLIKVPVKTDAFGFFDISAALFDKEGNAYSDKTDIHFSVVNAPPEGVRHKDLGVTIHAVDYHIVNHGDPVINMELAARAGFGFVRNEVLWRYYEMTPGVYKFKADYQKVVDRAREMNMEIVPILNYGNGAITDEMPPVSPDALEAFGQFAVHYKRDLGDLTTQMSVWNEYNLVGSGFNKDGRPPESYAELCKAAYTALKKDNPNTFVWGLVTAGIDRNFIKRVFDAGGGEYMDGIDVHHYSHKQTPERGGLVTDLADLKQIMADYGIADKPIYMSENGYASVGRDGYPDEHRQACYSVRLRILNDAHDLVDRYAFYTMNNGGINPEQEQCFGFVRSPKDVIPYEAKPSYLAIANYNALTIGAEYIGMLELDSDVAAYKYKLPDGRDCVIIWSIDGEARRGLNLGADSATVYDMYGNTSTYHSIDGVFSLSLTAEPIYLTGYFPEFSAAEPKITVDKIKSNIVKGDRAEINIAKTTDAELEIKVEASDKLTVEKNDGFVGNNAKILILAGMEDAESENVNIKVMQGEKCVYETPLTLSFSAPVDVSLLGVPYSAEQLKRRQVRFTLDSNSYSVEQAGVLTITSPEKLAAATEPIKIFPIEPGGSRVIDVNLPQELNGEKISIGAELKFESGEVLNLSRDTSFECAVYADNKPTIDGVISDGEWQKETRMRMTDKGFVGAKYYETLKIPYTGDEDLSAYAYTMWDEENFYIALEIKDDVLSYDKVGKILWRSDGIQFGMAPSRGSTQIMVADIAALDEPSFIIEMTTGVAGVGPVVNSDYKISRKDNITTFEIRVPWKSLFFDGFDPVANTPMAFSVMINDNDGDDREGYLEYGAGIGTGTKDSQQFLDLYMLGSAKN